MTRWPDRPPRRRRPALRLRRCRRRPPRRVPRSARVPPRSAPGADPGCDRSRLPGGHSARARLRDRFLGDFAAGNLIPEHVAAADWLRIAELVQNLQRSPPRNRRRLRRGCGRALGDHGCGDPRPPALHGGPSETRRLPHPPSLNRSIATPSSRNRASAATVGAGARPSKRGSDESMETAPSRRPPGGDRRRARRHDHCGGDELDHRQLGCRRCEAADEGQHPHHLTGPLGAAASSTATARARRRSRPGLWNCADIRGFSGVDNANTWGGKFYDNGVYIGHDEPDDDFVSSRPGSGGDVNWTIRSGGTRRRRRPPAAPGKDVSHWFELTPAPWLSMAICDPNSYPQLPCTAETRHQRPERAVPRRRLGPHGDAVLPAGLRRPLSIRSAATTPTGAPH